MGGVVKLVVNPVSRETVKMLRWATARAERGEIPGAAIILFYPGPGEDFVLDVAGVARDRPTLLRGALNKFDLELDKLPAKKRPRRG